MLLLLLTVASASYIPYGYATPRYYNPYLQPVLMTPRHINGYFVETSYYPEIKVRIPHDSVTQNGFTMQYEIPAYNPQGKIYYSLTESGVQHYTAEDVMFGQDAIASDSSFQTQKGQVQVSAPLRLGSTYLLWTATDSDGNGQELELHKTNVIIVENPEPAPAPGPAPAPAPAPRPQPQPQPPQQQRGCWPWWCYGDNIDDDVCKPFVATAIMRGCSPMQPGPSPWNPQGGTFPMMGGFGYPGMAMGYGMGMGMNGGYSGGMGMNGGYSQGGYDGGMGMNAGYSGEGEYEHEVEHGEGEYEGQGGMGGHMGMGGEGMEFEGHPEQLSKVHIEQTTTSSHKNKSLGTGAWIAICLSLMLAGAALGYVLAGLVMKQPVGNFHIPLTNEVERTN